MTHCSPRRADCYELESALGEPLSDDIQEIADSSSPKLGPVIARLEEIHRKCLSLGSRNEEAQEMAGRIAGVIAALSGAAAEETKPALGDLARELFPVARLFESLGFLSVARELAHVEKTLSDLDPGESADRAVSTDFETSARIDSPASPDDTVTGDSEVEAEDGPVPARGIPVPVALGFLAVVIAVSASIFIVRQQETRHEAGSILPIRTTVPPPTAPASPTPSHPIPLAEPTAPLATPTPGPRARMVALVGEARLAQREGDLNRAISLLSQAALIDSKAHLVLGTARSLVADLLNRADDAAGAAQWDEAGLYVERARELAIRFELPTQPMDAAVRRHARLERYELVQPTDTSRLRELAGHRAIVVTTGDHRYEGQIHDVVGGTLELHEGMEVGRGGTLFHVDEIPLAEVVEIRVYPD